MGIIFFSQALVGGDKNKKAMSNSEFIEKAIRDKEVITFIYKGGKRTVEPFTLGYHKTTDNLILRAFFISGYSSSGKYNEWKIYLVDEIENLELVGSNFRGTRVGYNPDDSDMSTILITLV